MEWGKDHYKLLLLSLQWLRIITWQVTMEVGKLT